MKTTIKRALVLLALLAACRSGDPVKCDWAPTPPSPEPDQEPASVDSTG